MTILGWSFGGKKGLEGLPWYPRAILGTTKLIFVLALGIVVASYGSGGGEDTRELMLLELSPGG